MPTITDYKKFVQESNMEDAFDRWYLSLGGKVDPSKIQSFMNQLKIILDEGNTLSVPSLNLKVEWECEHWRLYSDGCPNFEIRAKQIYPLRTSVYFSQFLDKLSDRSYYIMDVLRNVPEIDSLIRERIEMLRRLSKSIAKYAKETNIDFYTVYDLLYDTYYE